MNLDDVFAHLDPQERYAAASILRHDIQRRRKAAEAAREPRIIRDEKRCPSCGEVKAVTEFGIDRNRPDGRNWRCRRCR